MMESLQQKVIQVKDLMLKEVDDCKQLMKGLEMRFADEL
jgi:hypothetical protein